MCAMDSEQSAKSDIERDAGHKKVIIKKVKKISGGGHGGSWKVAYADFVTAMMAFFLLMWLINMVPTEKKAQLALIFRTESTSQSKGGGVTENYRDFPLRTNKQAIEAQLSSGQKLQYGMMLKMKELIGNNPEIQKNIGLSAENNGVLLRVDENVLFNPGSAELKPEAKAVMSNVIKILKDFNYDVIVQGHTDNSEPSGKYSSNWELSTSRAVAALNYIIKNSDVPGKRLRPVGFADTRPMMPNDTPENKAKNRRIEFFYYRPEDIKW